MESNRQAEMIYMSLFLENDDHLVNSQEHTEASNFPTASEEGNHEVQAVVSETITDIMSQSFIVVSDDDGASEEISSKDHVRLSKNDKQEKNPTGLEPKKFRMISEIYNESDDLGDDLSSDDNHNSYYSDDVTLSTFMESKRRMILGKNDHENDINIQTDNDSDDVMMAAEILFKMSNEGVQARTLYKTVTEEEALTKEKGKGMCEDDGHVSPVARHGLLQDIMHRMPVCAMNRNPSEFKTEEAKKFRREC